MGRLSSEIKYSLFLLVGAHGSFISFLCWLFFMSFIVLSIVGYRISLPRVYSTLFQPIFFPLLGVSYFLGSFACLGLSLINDSKVALVCFISYIGSGIAWSCSILNPNSWGSYSEQLTIEWLMEDINEDTLAQTPTWRISSDKVTNQIEIKWNFSEF